MEILIFRRANISDIEIYFNWLNDLEVRTQSYNSKSVSWDEHVKWFNEKINDSNNYFYIFQTISNENVGQVRIQKIDEINTLIGISIGLEHRGKGIAIRILELACKDYLNQYPNRIINSYIKYGNITSKLIFEKAGFLFLRNFIFNNFKSYHYVLNANRGI
jgi:RimJ/RimL family protein N-acetyltransferase